MARNQLVRDSVASRNSFETVPGVQLATLPPDQPVGTPTVASCTRFHDWRTSSRLPTSIVNGPVCTAAPAGAGLVTAMTVPMVAATIAPTTASAILFLATFVRLSTRRSLRVGRYRRASPRQDVLVLRVGLVPGRSAGTVRDRLLELGAVPSEDGASSLDEPEMVLVDAT